MLMLRLLAQVSPNKTAVKVCSIRAQESLEGFLECFRIANVIY